MRGCAGPGEVTRLGGFTSLEVAHVAEGFGWRFSRMRGDYMVYSKPGDPRGLSIADSRNLPEGATRSLDKTMSVAVEEVLRLARK